jgi:hypothetical protein
MSRESAWTMQDELDFLRAIGTHSPAAAHGRRALAYGYLAGLEQRVVGFTPGAALNDAERLMLRDRAILFT